MFHFDPIGTGMDDAAVEELQAMVPYPTEEIAGPTRSSSGDSSTSTCPITGLDPPIDLDTLIPLNYESPSVSNYVDPTVVMQDMQHGIYGPHNRAPEIINSNARVAPTLTSTSCKLCFQNNTIRNNVVRKPKRFRTAYTTNQIMALEQVYSHQRFIDCNLRKDLAQILHVTERAVKVWFQNRRMKEKKEALESSRSSKSKIGSHAEIGNVSAPTLAAVQYDYLTPVVDAKQPNAQTDPQYYRNAEVHMLPPHPWQQAAPASCYVTGLQTNAIQEAPQDSLIINFNSELFLN